GVGGSVAWRQAGGGEVVTRGDGADAVRLQSIGGGGGVAAVDGRAATGAAGPADAEDALAFELVTLTTGGRAGSTGSGGEVGASLAEGARLTTAGARSVGLLAQSVGGGGGISSFADADARWRKATLDVGGASAA